MPTRFLLAVPLALITLAASTARAATCPPATCKKLIDNGSDAAKRVLVVMGDGFSAAEQDDYNELVDARVKDGMFGHDFFLEEANAFNVYRINLTSAVSGVGKIVYDLNGTSNDGSDDTVVSTTHKNTALRYLYSGVWAHCWLQHTKISGTDITNQRKDAALAANGLSHADYVVVFLNESGAGGCNRGPHDIVQTKGVSWQVLGHEAGHGIGGLNDEYSNRDGNYPGDPVTDRNCSTVLNRNTVYWNRFISPLTPVPTTFGAGMDANRTVGELEGCKTWKKGIWRPTHSCRMRNNSPPYCPVCQTMMRKSLYGDLDHDFATALSGDFDGDGKSDLLVKNGNDLAIYRASTGPAALDRVWTANNLVPQAPGGNYWWTLAAGDRFHVADFNGDGKDDVYVINTTSWSKRWVGLLRSNGTGLETVVHYANVLPGYGSIGEHDQIKVADFDGDKKDDFYLFTGASWSKLYLGLIKSSGTGIAAVERYDDAIPGWIMAKDDVYHVADFDGDGDQDLYVWNGKSWSNKYLGMLRSSGTALLDIELYTNTLASGWKMGEHDTHHVADIDGDGRKDLYVWNGGDWGTAYLELTRSTGGALAFVKRYDDSAATAWATNVPGWTLKTGDRFVVADANQDGREDLFVKNTSNWGTAYLGTLVSAGNALSGSWTADVVNGAGATDWDLSAADKLLPVNYHGGAGKPDLFIRTSKRIGLIRKAPGGFVADRIYTSWIMTPLYDKKPLQDHLP